VTRSAGGGAAAAAASQQGRGRQQQQRDNGTKGGPAPANGTLAAAGSTGTSTSTSTSTSAVCVYCVCRARSSTARYRPAPFELAQIARTASLSCQVSFHGHRTWHSVTASQRAAAGHASLVRSGPFSSYRCALQSEARAPSQTQFITLLHKYIVCGCYVGVRMLLLVEPGIGVCLFFRAARYPNVFPPPANQPANQPTAGSAHAGKTPVGAISLVAHFAADLLPAPSSG
jgi:hypothetical protein